MTEILSKNSRLFQTQYAFHKKEKDPLLGSTQRSCPMKKKNCPIFFKCSHSAATENFSEPLTKKKQRKAVHLSLLLCIISAKNGSS
jgi:hypothetical protein